MIGWVGAKFDVARRRQGRHDGGLSTVEAAVLMPVVVLLVLLSIQAGILYHAHTTALAAAEEGGRTAASTDGTEAAGYEAAQNFLSRVAGDELRDTSVSVHQDDATGMVTTVVTGSALSLVPGWRPHVTATTKTPVERLTW